MSGEPVAVIGAGPSGLAAAFRLRQAGFHSVVFDRNDYPGGRFATIQRDGFVLDQGAQVIPNAHKALLRIASEAGLDSELVPGGSVVGFARNDEVHCIDTRRMVRDALRFRLLSGRAKLRFARVLLDGARMRRRLTFDNLAATAALDTESAAEYARRRLDDECLEYVIDAAMRGMLAANAELVSKVDLFFGLTKFIGVRFLAFQHGNSTYADRLSQLFEMRLSASVVSVEEIGDSVAVDWIDASGRSRAEDFAGCVLAVPAPHAADVHTRLDNWRLDFLRRVPYTRSVSLSAALERPPPTTASMIFVPRSVHPGLIGICLDHNKAPGRTPAGKGLVSAYSTDEWATELRAKDDDVVVKELLEAVDRVLPGVSDTVEFAFARRWEPTVMYARPGYYPDLLQFTRIAEAEDRLIRFGGDFSQTSNVNTATAAGERAAHKLAAALS